MTNFSGKNLNAACGGPQGGGMDSRRNGVAEVSPKYLADIAMNGVPVGYKQTAVGLIPEDWLTLTLGDIADLTSSKRIFESDYVKSGVPFYRGQEVSSLLNGSVIENVIYISQAKFNELAARFGAPKAGEILITAVGTLGNSFLIESNDPFYFKDGNLIWLRKIKNCQPKYLIKQLNYNKNRVLECAIGSSQKALTMVSLSPLLIPVPSKIEEQTAIANALSDVDALIGELEKLIAKKQAIKTATMQQLLTGRTRLPQFALREDGTPKGIKPSELGEIPEDWEVGAIGDSCRTYSGGTPSTSNKNFYGGGIKWITSSDLNQGVIHDVAGRITDAGLNGSSAKLVEAHTLLIALYGATAGVCAITRISAAINQAVLAIVPAEHNSEYLFYWFTRHKEVIIETYTQGGQPNLSGDIVRTIKLAFPPVNEQTAIATILSDMDEEIQALEQRLSKTRQIKQGMMQELLTGKTRLVQSLNKESLHG